MKRIMYRIKGKSLSKDKYISIDALEIKDKAYLGALLHTFALKEEIIIDFSQGIPEELAPTQTYREDIVASILKKGIIVTSEKSEVVAYPIYQNFLYEVGVKNIDKILTELMYPEYISINDKEEVYILLKEIQFYEAIEYMSQMLQKFHLPVFKFDKRYRLLFLQILKTYSLSQLFNFIYTAVRNQAAYGQININTYVPLANYIYKKIIDRYEKAILKDWDIMNFDRIWGWQQSELSKLVCNKLLNLGDLAFYEVINIENYIK